jgi:hypothetical protein
LRDREFEFPFWLLAGTHGVPPLFLPAQLLQMNSMNRGAGGVKHADTLLRSVSACHPTVWIVSRGRIAIERLPKH